MIHSRGRVRACAPRVRPALLVTVRCQDCHAAVLLPMDEVQALMDAHPDGTGTGLCECR